MKHAFQKTLKIIRKIFTWFLHFGKRAESTIVNVNQEISNMYELFVQFDKLDENKHSEENCMSEKEVTHDSKSIETQRS